MVDGDDGDVRLIAGTVRPVYAELTLPEGRTGVVQAGGTFTLYREDGSFEPGFNGLGLTGYESGPNTVLHVWYLLNSANLTPSAVYSGLFRFSVQTEEAMVQTCELNITICIVAPVEIIATYDESALLTSPLFQTRLHAGDTRVADAIWSDAELAYYLNLSGGSPQLAAANALEALALDRAKLANAVRVGAFGNGEKDAYLAIAERARRLRALSVTPPMVRPPERIFVPDMPGHRSRGTMKGW